MLGFTKQAYYSWRAAPVTDRDWNDAHLPGAAIDIHTDDPTFGNHFIADELAAQGHRTGENRVARLYRAQRLWSVLAKKPGTGRRPGPAVHDDHVQRRSLPRLRGRLRADHRLLHRLPREGRPGGVRAAMESFFALLQNDVFNQNRWRTRQELRLAIITWMERTYHRRRRQRRLATMTPIEYEAVHASALAA